MAVRRIEPDDVSRPILAVFGVWGRFSVDEIVIVAALVEGIILPTRNPLKKLKVLTKSGSNGRNIIYQAEVTTSHSKQTYIGLCDTSFKSRYRNHTCSFRNERYRNSTELSKYVWGLKDKKTDYQIRWWTIRHARSYSNVTKKCNLCLWEKYYIICRPNMATLNNRNELVSSCRHAKKFLLNNVII